MRWIWHVWFDNNITMALPQNDHEMTMPPWPCPSCVMVMIWSSYNKAIVGSWVCRDRGIVMIWQYIGQWSYHGHNMVIHDHSWAFLCYVLIILRLCCGHLLRSQHCHDWSCKGKVRVRAWSRHARGSYLIAKSLSCYIYSIVISLSYHSHDIVMPCWPKSYHGHVMILWKTHHDHAKVTKWPQRGRFMMMLWQLEHLPTYIIRSWGCTLHLWS